MSIAGLHHLIKSPVTCRHVGEAANIFIVGVALIRTARQHAVHDCGGLCATDFFIGLEGVLVHSRDPSIVHRCEDTAIEPVISAYIAELQRIAVIRLGKAGRNSCKLSTRD